MNKTCIPCERALQCKLTAVIALCLLHSFTSSANAVLIASDVAARGLDIPAVEHIVHYQVPRNSEVSEAALSVCTVLPTCVMYRVLLLCHLVIVPLDDRMLYIGNDRLAIYCQT